MRRSVGLTGGGRNKRTLRRYIGFWNARTPTRYESGPLKFRGPESALLFMGTHPFIPSLTLYTKSRGARWVRILSPFFFNASMHKAISIDADTPVPFQLLDRLQELFPAVSTNDTDCTLTERRRNFIPPG